MWGLLLEGDREGTLTMHYMIHDMAILTAFSDEHS